MLLDFDFVTILWASALALLAIYIIWSVIKWNLYGEKGQHFLTKNVRSIGRFSTQSISWAPADLEAFVINRKGVLSAGFLVQSGTMYLNPEKLSELIALLDQTDDALESGHA